MGIRHRVLRAIASVANMLVEDEGTLVGVEFPFLITSEIT
jgi:hypothetical protein